MRGMIPLNKVLLLFLEGFIMLDTKFKYREECVLLIRKLKRLE